MLRIYTINIDAAPLFGQAENLLKRAGFRPAHLLVNGLFTSASINSMLYGKVYDSVRPGDPFLVDILLEEGFIIEVHEGQRTFLPDGLGEEWRPGFRPSPRTFLRKLCPELRHPRYANIIVSAASVSGRPFSDWRDPGRYREFMANEAAYFEQIQAEGGQAYTHVEWAHYHDLVYDFHQQIDDPAAWLEHLEQTLTDWLSLWNFDEPDALFFVFSDHGDCVNRLTPPKDYWRWCFIRDNTAGATTPRTWINGADVLPTVLHKIGRPADPADIAGVAWDAPLDPDRIYHLADTRYWDENRSSTELDLVKHQTHDPVSMGEVNHCMNATAVKFIAWQDEQTPTRLLQATYYRATAAYYFLIFEPDLDDPLFRYSFFNPATRQPRIITTLRGEESLKPLLLELCQSLVERFDWIENRDFAGQIERGEFPEWIHP
ncbi:hypothetical protein [Elongatibacter sediminis]|uniref:Sulfatase N-terminal domain-containing protein n=1 Tax=Elongatibacter sediminis TaxID=3119006 RepID=A0AAW9RJN9_9GAMM